MQVTTFQHFQDIWPRLEDVEPGDFLNNRAWQNRPEDKKMLPCWSLVQYKPGTRRSKHNVESVHALVLDYDSIAETHLGQVLASISGLRYWMHTTYSHKVKNPPGVWSCRVIIPLTAPIYAQSWTALYKAIAKKLPHPPDKACADPSRLFALPCKDPDGTPAPIFYNEGALLDLGSIAAEALRSPEPGERLAVTSVQMQDLEMLYKKLSKSPKPERIQLAMILRALLDGRPYAMAGQRHEMMLRITHYLANELPDVPSDILAGFFAESQAAMGEGADNIGAVAIAIEGARAKRRESVAKFQAEKDDEQRERIAAARRDGNDHAYTPEELQSIADRMRCSVEQLKHRWIIFHGNMAWFLTLQGYVGPFAGKDTLPAMTHHFSPAPVRTKEMHGDGPHAKWVHRQAVEMLSEYGTEARAICADLTAPESYYNHTTQTFHEATAPRSNLKPVYHQNVHAWLWYLGGEDRDKLIDWMASVTRLDKQCCALYLCGVEGVGKTLLATGLAKIWRRGMFTPIRLALSQFNSAVAACPLIFADEYMPKDKAGSGALRALLGNTNFVIERKGMEPVVTLGTVRLIFAANNPWMIQLQENNARSDLEALARRVRYITPMPEAAQYLLALPQEEREAWATHKIAEMALWLAQNHGVNSNSRFLVEGGLGDSLRRLLVSNDNTSLICEWLTGYLMRPQPIDTQQVFGQQVFKGQGRLLVTTGLIRGAWNTYHLQTTYPLSTKEINTALGAIALSSETVAPGGKMMLYWDIDLPTLGIWAETHGQATMQQIMEACR